MRNAALLVLLSSIALILSSARLAPADEPAQHDDATKQGMKALQGTWKTVATEQGGETIVVPPGVTTSVKIQGDHYDTLYPGSPSRPAKGGGSTITLDPKHDPKQIDFLPANDPEAGKDASRPVRGIYALDKDTLRICFNPEPGGERPTDFSTKPGSRVRCITLKRKSPAATAPAE